MWPRRDKGWTGKVPEWPSERRAPRILVEASDGADAWACGRVLRSRGWEVAVCPGPADLPEGRCPLVTEGRCPAAEGADAIVFLLPMGQPENRSILWAHRARRSATPVVVEATEVEAPKYAALLRDLEVVFSPVFGKALADAVERNLPGPS